MSDTPSFDATQASVQDGVPVRLFEIRGAETSESVLENNVKSLILGPAHGEFLCAPVRVNSLGGTNNASVGGNDPDLVHSVRQMLQTNPNLEHITLTPAFYGNDLRAGECVIAPRVAANHSPPTDAAQAWAVAGTGAGSASATTNPLWQGTPADWALSACIAYLKDQGLKVSVMPVLLMDISPDNQLPDPYRTAAVGQPAYPSSNLITGSLTDFMTQYTAFMTHYATLAKEAGADGFIAGYGLDGLIAEGAVGTPDTTERLCGVSGVDRFPNSAHSAVLTLVCDDETSTEGTASLGGIIRFTSNSAWNGGFELLISGMPNITGTATKISGGNTGEREWRIDGVEWDFTNSSTRVLFLASDNSVFTPPENALTFTFDGELTRGDPALPPQADTALPALLSALSPLAPDQLGFALSPQNNLTPVGDLIASSTATAFIALTHTFPLSDWRRGREHADKMAGASSQYSLDYLRGNIAGGEGFDWDYADDSDALTQTRQTNPAPSLINGRKYKDIAGWRLGAPARALKPIVFCEIGCRAVNYGANRYNAGESLPVDALDLPDLLCQRSYSEAVLSYYGDVSNNPVSESGVPMVDLSRCSVREWDMRYHPYALRSGLHPDLTADWPQGWQLNGRARRPFAVSSVFPPRRFTDHAERIEHPVGSGFWYHPIQITGDNIKREAELNTSEIGFDIPQALDLHLPDDQQFLSFLTESRSPVPLTMRIMRGHITDAGATPFLPLWSGRIIASSRSLDKVELQALPFATGLNRNGVKRNYQLSCPHVLGDSLCKVHRRDLAFDSVCIYAAGANLTLSADWSDSLRSGVRVPDFIGGSMEWTDGGFIYRRGIVALSDSGEDLVIGSRIVELGKIFRTYDAAVSAYNNNPSGSEPIRPNLPVRMILGCDKSFDNCERLHNNLANYGGCPSIPDKNPFNINVRRAY